MEKKLTVYMIDVGNYPKKFRYIFKLSSIKKT